MSGSERREDRVEVSPTMPIDGAIDHGVYLAALWVRVRIEPALPGRHCNIAFNVSGAPSGDAHRPRGQSTNYVFLYIRMNANEREGTPIANRKLLGAQSTHASCNI